MFNFFFGQRVDFGPWGKGFIEAMGTTGAFAKLDKFSEGDSFKHMDLDYDQIKDAESGKPLLLIHRGLPGSGKTTAAKKIRKYCEAHGINFYHHEADHFHEDADGNYNWRPENVGRSHKQCQQLTRESLAQAKHDGSGIVVVANTNTRHKEMQPYIDMADEMGIEYRVVAFGTIDNIDVLYERNTHNVPKHTFGKMRGRWQPLEGEIIIP